MPTTSTSTASAGFDRTQDFGNLSEGDNANIRNNCGYLVGSQITKTFNGTTLVTVTVGPDGCLPTDINALDDGVGNPTALGRIGPLFATVGLEVAQATRVPRVRIDGQIHNANALGVRNSLVVQGTAADGGSGRWTNYFTLIGPAGNANVGGSGLGRTGGMILRWSMLGGSILAVGALLVMASRRRRTDDLPPANPSLGLGAGPATSAAGCRSGHAR